MMQFSQAKWIALAVGTTAVAMTATPKPVEAAAVKYNLQGVTLSFEQGGFSQTGNLTGSFFFDGTTNEFSDIAINSSLSGGYIAASAPGSTASQLSLSRTIFSALNLDLLLNFTSPLTGALGDIAAIDTTTSSETLSFNFFGFPVSASASISSGFVTSGSVAAIPTPALLPGLVGLGVAVLRKRKSSPSTQED
ncbi:MAG TPA: PTPA-CTERM sorting domain-containing protein [Leptolyngbyaceae cyanobacterium M33_DOE_097]|uniref:PTPA-CTERM sorting domain-containing protein n=1 Tax=Oscillatoriales cyanobacterium SpSt-418 TaxID=2282169 RepID=A0A7C3KF16_9CYAN|nr:PTPA-CTERM sorting domain-containing protein [Leptolyngbyaceae cyanobacterium M33_DOE_097]